MSNILELQSVWKVYGAKDREVVALKSINFAIEHGEYVALVGPSGAGKSTLLHVMGGLDTPTKGKVLFEEKDISRLGDYRASLWRNISVGFVFQFYHLIEELSVLENVALPSFLTQGSRKTSFKKAQKLLEYLDILDKKHCVPSQLSGGQRQKVAIARALVNEPKVVFCDEPTGNLDRLSAEKVMALLESLHKERGKTLVVVTHNPDLVKEAQRVIDIAGGQIRKEEA